MIPDRFWRAAVRGALVLFLGAGPLGLKAGETGLATKRPTRAIKSAQPVAASGFRARTDSALSAPVPTTPGGRKAQAETLVSLYKQIGEAKEVGPADRTRLQARLKSRLARLAGAIALDVKQARTARQSQADTSSTANQLSANRSSTDAGTPSPSKTAAGAGGGAPQDDGQALVELIQATIAPQSWDVIGGPGSIVYWPAWHVLVVRQTDDVHEQIGGVVRGVRK